MASYRELQNTVNVSPDDRGTKSGLELLSGKVEKWEMASGQKIPEIRVDDMAKLLRKGLKNSSSSTKSTIAAIKFGMAVEGFEIKTARNYAMYNL